VFKVSMSDAIATAGSCFAQHLANALRQRGCTIMVTEASPLSPAAQDESYGIYTARFGNIYTIRQLLQLLSRAYGLFVPGDEAWVGRNGRFVDPFRPLVQAAGFDSLEAVQVDRAAHLGAVRAMFEGCDVFVFTFGLTEAWESVSDGAVFPIVPQAVAPAIDPANYRFRNFRVSDMLADLRTFIQRLRQINPEVRLILTVSPVPLLATFEERHVLVSNAYSKSALRVVADEICNSFNNIEYFPSFEIITGPHAGSAYLADDLREVSLEGITHVMSVFTRHYLAGEAGASDTVASGKENFQPKDIVASATLEREAELLRAGQRVICDEEVIVATR
jgi:hypothetical protein